jgi:predicted ribosome quality control (RQC) complex YloA/Tae2 family protein
VTEGRHAAFGAADLERVLLEAAPRLLGARLRSVRPRGRTGLLLGFAREEEAAEAEPAWLLVSLEPGLARAHLVERPPREPKRRPPSALADGLRARLSGARVAALAAVPGDRVLRLELEAAPVEGAAGPEGEGGAEAGPAGGAEAGSPGGPAGEAAAGAGARPGASGGRFVLWLSFFAAKADLVLEDAGSGAVVLGLREGSSRPLLSSGAAPSRPPLLPEVAPDPSTLAYSRALAARFLGLEEERRAAERRRLLEAEIARRRRRAEGARRRLEEAARATATADETQRTAEVLLASLHLVPRGAREALLPDYWAPPGEDGAPALRRVALDPALPPSEQAERLFRAAKKARRGAAVTRERLARFTEEVARLDAALLALAAGRPAEEVARDAGVPLPPAAGEGPEGTGGAGAASGAARAGRRGAAQGPGGPRRFRSRDGLEILVGRSNAENDELTTRIARPHDIFVHVSGVAGSHVIVRVERGKTAPLETLLDAAALAVLFGKARGRPRAEVGYAPRKWVRKPRGAKPGLVVVERQKTLVVLDAEERLARLLAGAPPGGGPEAPGAGERGA